MSRLADAIAEMESITSAPRGKRLPHDCQRASDLAKDVTAYITAGGPIPFPYGDDERKFMRWVRGVRDGDCNTPWDF